MLKRAKIVVVLLVMGMSTGIVRAEPAAGSRWREPVTHMEFVWVPSGCIDMGSREGIDNERPVHRVCLKGFYLGKYEVTQAQYRKLTGGNPGKFKGAARPVEEVDWTSAAAAADALGEQSGSNIRLPSEAEWEYACRAGGMHDAYCGAGAISDLAWHSGNSGGKSHAVGRRRPNAWGLYDMSGNVWEWTQDCWHEGYEGAPADGRAWTSGGDCERRVVRGGSWYLVPTYARAAIRGWLTPHLRFSYVGFRLVRTPP